MRVAKWIMAVFVTEPIFYPGEPVQVTWEFLIACRDSTPPPSESVSTLCRFETTYTDLRCVFPAGSRNSLKVEIFLVPFAC